MSPNFIFFNSVSRLRSGWRFAVFVIGFVLVAVFLTSLVGGVFMLLGNSEMVLRGRSGFLISSSVLLFSSVAVGWLCAKYLEDLPVRSLGWSFQRGWLRDFIFGILFGAGSLLLTAGIAAIGGGLSFRLNAAATGTAVLKTMAISFLIFALGAAAEEALFRGYALQTFVRARLVWIAVLLTSAFFAQAHAENPHTNILGLINTALAGVWLVAAYLKTRNLWFAFGIHLAWNWTMGAVLGIPVSGLTSIAPNPVLRPVGSTPVWLTGGDYGLEGGAACTVALVLSTILIWFAPFLKPDEEMLALTNQENPKKLSEPPAADSDRFTKFES